MRLRASFTPNNRDTKNNIVFIEDISNQTGGMSVTNDAEAVVTHFRTLYGNRVRIVYKDTENEWWEIKWTIDLNGTHVNFKQWYGLEWDLLSRAES